MSVMFEVMYEPPTDARREGRLAEQISHFGGRLDYREESATPASICLTFEFDDWAAARAAAARLRELGEYIEGPMEYS
ncbi:MAG: hypothetical protein U0793_29635 [Gemmataceae bacterium]